jgi:DNA repair protein RecO (recombination protein O)
MIERATGLILRTRRLTETSLILHWLTPELGRLSTVAKGALRPKSPFAGKLDLFFEADLSFVRSRRSDLHTLREVSLRDSHPKLRQDLDRLRIAACAARWIELATETETPVPEPFLLMRRLLACLDTKPASASLVFAFELALLTLSGLRPALEPAPVSAGTRKALALLASAEWAQLDRLKLSEAQVREIDRFLRPGLLEAWPTLPVGRAEAIGVHERSAGS